MTTNTAADGRSSERAMSGPMTDHYSPPGRPHIPVRMLRLAQVIDRTGLGKTTIYELQKLELFPKSVLMTARSVRWIEAEIEAWMAQRANARTPTLK